ncbi:alpha-D-ribose 1-methylphosphonate 5-phosphate C-P-lyase PhnJ [Halosimplex litoreum]|uniref:Alpha-D-ribose 1-methylphosphonate 5-phosphate C-P-lyase PhnJ n=1 Tax=Halosimplex litoreum TaxID=1198301 RepID=A0A7T3KVI5_9EURY|nr:alpha-D-ribose 1-methylphosphonate 5-phosphate C-P-lyase PhnJ [Halosimplex litoreum]QPV63327.1 alpha-D-ribose 1-methylphosphonate 5-phosphate C-P-lyase PhnJ [Halosimplex litoreum]
MTERSAEPTAASAGDGDASASDDTPAAADSTGEPVGEAVSALTVADAVDDRSGDGLSGYNYAYLDEHTKREVRRAVLKGIAIPGHQVPFASRPMPLARGWGTGGIQASLSLLGPEDAFKVIDQGSDESVNAANIRRLAETTANVETTTDTTEADVVQTRHRIPEEVLTDEQIVVLQVPITDALRSVDSSDAANRRRHAHANYGKMWVHLYENVVEWGEIQIASRYPTMVAGRYLMDPSPIPRWDVPKLDDADNLFVFAAGREARIYAVPPHTEVEPLAFEDESFQVERFPDQGCRSCGSTDTYLTEIETDDGDRLYVCNDTSFCLKRQDDPALAKDHHLDRSGVNWGPGTPGGPPFDEDPEDANGGETPVEDADSGESVDDAGGGPA